MFFGGWVSFSDQNRVDRSRFLSSLSTHNRKTRTKVVETEFGFIAFANRLGVPLQDQCHVHEDGSVLIVLGDVFNPAGAYPPSGAGGRHLGVAERLFLGWRGRGDEIWDKIDGEFASVIYDAPSRRLVLICDHLETYSIYYKEDSSGCLFSTELTPIFGALGAEPELDPDYLIESVMSTANYSDRSPFRGVQRVRLGSTYAVAPQSRLLSRWCRPENAPDVRYPNDDDYVDACLDLLRTVIGRRLGTTGLAAAHCSAGLDSTLVVAVAAEILGGQGRELLTYTGTTDPVAVGNGWKKHWWDEGATALAWTKTLPNVRSNEVSWQQENVLDDVDMFQHGHAGPNGHVFGVAPHNRMIASAAKAGALVLLTGVVGNQTTSFDGVRELHGMVRRGQLGGVIREWAALRRNGNSLKGLIYQTFGPFLPLVVIDRIFSILGRSPDWDFGSSPLHPGVLATRLGALENWRTLRPQFLKVVNTREFRSLVLRLGGIHRLTHPARRLYGLPMRHPLGSAPVVAFTAGLPPDQFLLNGETRRLARRMLRRLGVPSSITEERRRGTRMAGWHLDIVNNRAALDRDLETMSSSPVAREIFDVPRIHQALSEWPADGFDRKDVMDRYWSLLVRTWDYSRFIRKHEKRN